MNEDEINEKIHYIRLKLNINDVLIQIAKSAVSADGDLLIERRAKWKK